MGFSSKLNLQYWNFQVDLHDGLRSMSNDIWATCIGVGVVAVLQNRVGNASDRSLMLIWNYVLR